MDLREQDGTSKSSPSSIDGIRSPYPPTQRKYNFIMMFERKVLPTLDRWKKSLVALERRKRFAKDNNDDNEK